MDWVRYAWDCRITILELASVASIGLVLVAGLVVFVRGLVR